MSCGAEEFAGSPHPLVARYPDEIEVTQLYGPLVVRPGSYRYEVTATLERSVPWNTWFFPLKDKYFFDSPVSSPLEKYDQYVSKYASVGLLDPASRAREWEANRYQTSGFGGVADWMGYCHATAAAGILGIEPLKPLKVGNITFSIGDLKALMIRTYENIDGARNFGSNFGSDRERRSYISQADLYPDQLLRLIQKQIGDQGTSFYIDSHSSEQIWNEPVASAHVSYEEDPASRERLVGKLTIWTMKSDTTGVVESERRSGRVYDFLNSPTHRSFSETFQFELFGRFDPSGDFRVEFGEWTGTSKIFHPDFATVVPEGKPGHQSSNPHLKTEIVEEILMRAAAP